MRMFVIGGGGREHALVWHLHRHYADAALFCAPGNPGISALATCLPISATDLESLAGAASSLEIDLTIVGPEAPLVAGIADLFEMRGLPVVGPSALASALEGSKVFAKGLMERHRIPTAEHAAFDEPAPALRYLAGASGPVVVKADGLAAGKGVIVCDDRAHARSAVETMMVDHAFGDAGQRIVIEERLEGDEASVFALVDGEAVALLPAAADHKRAHDGDQGPNTGGMGAAAPVPLSRELRERILSEIIQPTARAMCAEGRPYRGVLFAGLMLTSEGPKVLEFNCRLGDPEAQVILPLLETGLPDAFAALREDGLAGDSLSEARGAAVGVVMASGGYPERYETGIPIAGLEQAAEEALVFHSGTSRRDGIVTTGGGRVLTVVGQGGTIGEARASAYRAAGSIRFDGMHYRRDIGARLEAVAQTRGGALPAGRR
ncbi:MAG: phosphoribosylamine--glycine ligase [Armatimonadetes bacterium]|nr:phosphoribosylamine--glycine ligase [Armatimonadota bacterium]